MASRTQSRKSQKTTFFPAHWTEAFKATAGRATGVVFLIIFAFLTVCLITYDQTDPSGNAVGTTNIHNLAGKHGAHAADVLLQSLGLGAGFLTIWFGVWGWRQFTTGFPKLSQWRIISLLLGTLALITGLAAMPAPGFWALESSLGGITGMVLLGSITDLIPHAFQVGLVCLAISFVLLRYSFAVGHRQLLKLAVVPPVVIGIWLLGCIERLQKAWKYRHEFKQQVKAELSANTIKVDKAGQAEKPVKTSALQNIKTIAKKVVEETAPSNVDVTAPTPPLLKAKAIKKKTSSSGGSTIPAVDSGDFNMPPLELLTEFQDTGGQVDKRKMRQNEAALQGVLEDFGVKGEIIGSQVGPVVTLYELEPAPGIKSSRVISLADDIARSMSALSARVAVVPGRNIIGIELPNEQRQMVSMRAILDHESFHDSKAKLPLALGKNINGEPVTVDLAKMPHLLVAGTTGSGKSVSVNTMILSLLYCLPPDKCRFIMIDPKMLELSIYDDIPHLLSPVVTDPKKAVVALKWTVKEMESRYQAMSMLGVRNIEGYNQRIKQALKKGEALNRRVQTGFDQDTGQPIFEDQPLPLDPLPYIVVIVDEMADLMLVAGKEIEAAIQRLAQMARAAGIHIIMATQRPSVDVITGTIKANFPTRISFQVTSKIDSRTILGEMGAEQLLGQGDMLHMAGGGRISRVHGSFVSDEEVESIVAHLKEQGTPEYIEDVTVDTDGLFDDSQKESSGDELYDRAVDVIRREGKVSTSFIQRQLQIGYNRAARIVEQMESEGLISPAGHNGKREVL